MCLSVCVSKNQKNQKNRKKILKKVCGARRLKNKNYSGFQNSEFFFEKFEIRTFFFKMVDRKLKNLDETSKRGFCLNYKPPITFIC